MEAEERFDELFRAARVLLRERVGQEDRVIPTLAYAGYNCEHDLYSSRCAYQPNDRYRGGRLLTSFSCSDDGPDDTHHHRIFCPGGAFYLRVEGDQETLPGRSTRSV